MPTINQRRLAVSVLGLALAAAFPPAFAANGDHVQSVVLDANRGVLAIDGVFAGTSAATVYLTGYASPLEVLSRTGTSLQVQLPAGVAPGNHELIVGDDASFAFTIGPVGPQGDVGPAGPTGTPGTSGPRGDAASLPTVSTLASGSGDCLNGGTRIATPSAAQVLCNGTDGTAGADGKAGLTGPSGPKGLTGMAGITGATGPRGAKGDDGAVGPAGPKGPIGDSGARGATGFRGVRGQVGPQGPRGPVGPVSTQPGVFAGPPGSQGPQGAPGTNGQRNIVAQGAIFYDVPSSHEGTVATFGFTPPSTTGPGDLILTLDAMAIMTADWDGCEMRLRFVIGGRNYTIFPVSRYMPRNVARHVTYTVAVPNVMPEFLAIHVLGSSDCPQTRLTRITSGAQWLNRLP